MSSQLITVDDIPVTLTRKSMKNIRLAVKSTTGEVRLSAPHHVSLTVLKAFLYQHLPWLRSQQDEFHAKANQRAPEYAEGEKHFLWGEEKHLSFSPSDSPGYDPSTYDPANNDPTNTIHLNLPRNNDADARQAALMQHYRQELQQRMDIWVPYYQAAMELDAKEWRIRRMKTRWGTCNIQCRRIWLNLYLAAYPEHCLQYVIVHELAHLLETNHTPRFWRIVERYFPNWREVRRELNSRQLVWC